ncbi:MAG: hypothetical protein VXY93_22405, partial [Pseudomonadota bacterium]|nr:hypothetical protein [Pseudomonadota bacterium]
IYNDGTNSRIENQTGQLIVSSPIFTVQTGNYNQIISREAAEVDLYYKGVKKFSTASSGINVVGTTTSTQLAITGVSTFTGAIDANGDLDVDGHTNLDNVSIAGVTTTTDNIIIDADAKKLQIGASQDLEIFKDGNHCRIKDNNSADPNNYSTVINTDHLRINNLANTENI